MFARILPRLLVSGFAVAAPVSASVGVSSSPPPVVTMQPFTQAGKGVLTWRVESVMCGDQRISDVDGLVVPYPQPLNALPELAPATLSFDLDAEGRPFNITGAMPRRSSFLTRDLMPSLRASQFPAGGARTGCSITYGASVEPLVQAPLATLGRLGAVPRQRLAMEAWDRIAPGDCRKRPRPDPLLRAVPDWRTVDGRAGERAWTYVAYDLDAAGVPINLTIPVSSGDSTLDAAALAAAAQDRYAEGPRTGCAKVWWKNPDPIAAPPIPAKGADDGNPGCRFENRWERAPSLTYPENYRQRGIEGWAILRFDVAPWGEIGAITVMDAQPSSDFGEAAVNVLRNAKFKPQDAGLSGCVERIVFRFNPGAQDDTASDADAMTD